MILTPQYNNSRLQLTIGPDEAALVEAGLKRRDGKWLVHVTDIDSGKDYWVRGAACGRGCFCDAEVVGEILQFRAVGVEKDGG